MQKFTLSLRFPGRVSRRLSASIELDFILRVRIKYTEFLGIMKNFEHMIAILFGNS